MAYNTTIILIGNLGADPTTYTKENGSFMRLSIATTDSYKDSKTGAWMNRKPVWHTVFVNSTKVQERAQQYKKGDRVKITGSLSYRRINATDKAHSATFNEAIIAANRIEDAALQKRDES